MKTVHAFFFAREVADLATLHLIEGLEVEPDAMCVQAGTGFHRREVELIVDLPDREAPAVSAALEDVGAHAVEID